MTSPRPRRVLTLFALAGLLAACGDGTSTLTPPVIDAAPVDATPAVDAADVADAAAPAVDVPPEPEEPIETFRPTEASPTTPITATADQWTWVPFPDTACGNGAPTGLAVSLRPGSRRLVIF